MPVTYHDGITPVLPGDRVSVRFLFRRRPGEVTYVPGVSERRGAYEHNGLTWVGIALPKGWAIGEVVLPETQRLKPSVRFLGRGTQSAEAALAIQRLDAEESAAPETGGTIPEVGLEESAPPKPLDWWAGLTSLALFLGAAALVVAILMAALILLRKAL